MNGARCRMQKHPAWRKIKKLSTKRLREESFCLMYHQNMAEDFLAKFTGNTNGAKLLRLFTFNAEELYTAAQAAKRSGATSRSLSKELVLLERLDLIKKVKVEIRTKQGSKSVEGKQKIDTWKFNADSKHAAAVKKFVHEVSPVQYDRVVRAIRKSGKPTAVILSGCFVGDPTRPADLIIAADTFNESRLEKAVKDLEPSVGREIRYAAFTTPEFRYRLTVQDRLLRDTLDFPHLILLDKTRLL
jgi:hypothetical protein